jgi:hypothetical protein
MRIRNLFDPGSGMEKFGSRIRDKLLLQNTQLKIELETFLVGGRRSIHLAGMPFSSCLRNSLLLFFIFEG